MSNPTPEAPPIEEPQNTPTPEAPAPEDTPKPDAADGLRRKLAEEERARKRLEDQQKKAKEDQAAEQGRWQELAQQREQELETERQNRAKLEHEQRVTTIASRLKFVDPADVVYRVPMTEGADESTVETQLSQIADRSPHLIAKEAPAKPEIGQVHEPAAGTTPAASADGKPQPPAGKAPLQSLDEYEALPQTERIERMAEVDWLYLHEK